MIRVAVLAGSVVLAVLVLARARTGTALRPPLDEASSISSAPSTSDTWAVAALPGAIVPIVSAGQGTELTESGRTSDMPASSAATPDAEWVALPRSRRNFARELVERPQDAAAPLLLRSTAFNPRDQWIAPAGRAAFAAAVNNAMPAAAAGAEALAADLAAEFAVAEARGLAHVLDLASTNLAMEPFGRDPLVHVVANVTYCIARADAPGASRRRHQLRDQGSKLVAALARAFAAAGTLTDEELEDLLQQATRHADD